MATIPFIAYEISGLAFPTTTGYYNSGAVNYGFVNAVSGSLAGRITAGGGVQNAAFQAFAAETTGVDVGVKFIGTSPWKVSGLGALELGVAGYSTISAQAFEGHNAALSGTKWYQAYKFTNASGGLLGNLLASGNEYTAAYKYINPSGALLANLLASGNEYTKAYKYINPSGVLLANLLASGNEYTKAYKSGLASKSHAYHAKISSAYLAVNYGWATATNGSATIAHGLLSLPKSHWVVPSGVISFGIVTKVDTTNITAAITAAGSRILQWWASV